MKHAKEPFFFAQKFQKFLIFWCAVNKNRNQGYIPNSPAGAGGTGCFIPMNPDRWKQIKSIVQSALEVPKNERLVLATKQCEADADLFQEVWSLLEAYDQADQFLNVPAYRTHIPPTRLAHATGSATLQQSEPPDRMGSQEVCPGTVIHQRYRIERELGRGGIGVVYLAKQTGDGPVGEAGPLVVIKTLLPDSTANVWLKKKFQHEMEALQRIRHPNVVSLLDTGTLENGNPYFIMPFIDGTSLRTLIQPAGLPVSRASHILLQIGRGLQAAHAEGILHRDLKPENVLLQSISPTTWAVKLIDFGIARIENPTSATTTGKPVTVGTLLYMTPEQITAGKTTIQTDIFSFAVLAFELFTGHKPFEIPNRLSSLAAMQLLTQLHQQGPPVWPAVSANVVPAPVQQAVLQALSFRPSDRQRSLQDVLTVFEH